MAQKKITDLTLRTDFDATCNLPADDTAQTWRVTGAQLKAFLAPFTTIGDLIYAGVSGVATRLAAGAAGQVLTSAGAAAPTWAYPKILAYVGTNPEPGGSSPFTLTTSHNRVQDINPAGAITILLPTTGVLAGEIFTVRNRSTNLVTIQSSGGNEIYAVNTGYVSMKALQATPTSAAHWTVSEVDDRTTLSLNGSGSFTGGGSIHIARAGLVVNMALLSAATHASTSIPSSASGFLPAKFRPTGTVGAVIGIAASNVQDINAQSNGTVGFSYRDWAGSLSNQTSTVAAGSLTWSVAP